MRKSIVLGSIAAMGLAGQAFAEDGFSYTNLEAAYINTEIDDFDVDGDGFGIAGSVGFGSNFFGFAGYSDVDLDFDAELQELDVGVGFHWPVNPTLDFVTRAQYVDLELDVPLPPGLGGGTVSASEDGYGLGVGLRGRVLERLELTGDVDYVDVGDADDTTFGIGGRYYFTSMFAAGANVSFNDDGTAWQIAARYDFGKK